MDRHTDEGNYNTRRPKLASGKKCMPQADIQWDTMLIFFLISGLDKNQNQKWNYPKQMGKWHTMNGQWRLHYNLLHALRYYFHLFTSLWPGDAIWRHGTRSILVQVMSCCLTAPSHYLNQWVQRHSSESNFTIDNSAINHWNYFENYSSKISFKSPRGQWVNINSIQHTTPCNL